MLSAATGGESCTVPHWLQGIDVGNLTIIYRKGQVEQVMQAVFLLLILNLIKSHFSHLFLYSFSQIHVPYYKFHVLEVVHKYSKKVLL